MIDDLPKDSNTTLRGVSSVIGGLLHKVALSSIMSYGNFYPYLLSFLHQFDSSCKIQHGFFIMPIMTISLFTVAPVGGFIDNKLGTQRAVIIGVLFILSAAFILLSSTNLYIDYLTFVLFGIGVGVSSMATGKNACHYFMKNRGMVTAILASFMSLGGSMFTLAGEMIINPDGVSADENKFYPYTVAEKFKSYLVFQMCIVALLILLSVFFIVPYQHITSHKEANELKGELIPPSPRISSTSDEAINQNSTSGIVEGSVHEKPLLPLEEKINPNDYSMTHISKAWKSWRVWRLFLMILFSSFGVTMIMTTYRTIAIAKNINTRIVQIIGTSGFIIMCVCTPLWGVLADKINFRFLLLILNIASATLSYLYYLSIFNDISFLIATLSYLL